MLKLAHSSRFGLGRAALFKDNRPHLYLEGLENDPSLILLGVRSIARLSSKSGGVAFLSLADGSQAILDVPQDQMAGLNQGIALEVEIIAEARCDKRARARLVSIRDAEALAPLSDLTSVKQRLLNRVSQIFPDQPIVVMDQDENDEALITAREESLSPSGTLMCGGYLSIEPTRALIACDVDAGTTFASSAKLAAKTCNEEAVVEVVRRLRLSNLAGLVIVDLIGNRHDADRLKSLMTKALAAESKSIIYAPLGKFGTLEFTRPWGAAPLASQSIDYQAHSLILKAIEAAKGDSGARFRLRASDPVIDYLRPLIQSSHDPLSARLILESDPRKGMEVIKL